MTDAEKERDTIPIIREMAKATAHGAILSYQDATLRCNEPVTSQHPSMRWLMDRGPEEGLHFESVPTVGYRRLAPGATVGRKTKRLIGKIRRAGKRTLTTTEGVMRNNWGELTSEEKVTLAAQHAATQEATRATHGNHINSIETKLKTKAPSHLDQHLETLRTQYQKPAS